MGLVHIHSVRHFNTKVSLLATLDYRNEFMSVVPMESADLPK